jgi:hypothetical protein
MKRTLILVTSLLISAGAQAQATTHYEMTYHDMIRPNGQPRSDATYNAALDVCYRQTGEAREDKDGPAFKACMKQQGYRYVSTRLVRDKASPPAKDDTYIDPDNGMSCHDVGGIAICVPPQGTVHYTNRHGLNCTRTGIAAFCSSF